MDFCWRSAIYPERWSEDSWSRNFDPLRNRQKPMRQSRCWKHIQNSSENTKSCHPCVQLHAWTHHWRRSSRSASSSSQSMLLQMSSNCLFRHLLFSKWPHFLTHDSWLVCTIHQGHSCKMFVFLCINEDNRWDAAHSFIWTSPTHRFFILQIVMGKPQSR